jgi:hypothetical protein
MKTSAIRLYLCSTYVLVKRMPFDEKDLECKNRNAAAQFEFLAEGKVMNTLLSLRLEGGKIFHIEKPDWLTKQRPGWH